MKPQKCVRPFPEEARTPLGSGCRALDAFTVWRCQMLLASAEGVPPSTIASPLRGTRQTAPPGLEAFAERGLDCLRPGLHVPRRVAPVLTDEQREHRPALRQQSPRNFCQA